MTIYLHNRVKETTTTSGTGDITLAGAADSFQAFSAVLSDGQQTYYTVVSTNDWEVGIGTYTAGTLSRDTILSSSNSGSAISLSRTSTVFIAYPSEKSVYKDENDQVVAGSSGILLSSGIPANTSNTLYTNGTALLFNGVPIAGAAYTAGTGLQLDGLEFNIDDTVLQSGDNVSFLTNDAGYLTEHPSITSASSSDNSGRTYIQDILLDDNGHVTGVATATETVTDTDTTYTAGTGLSLVGTEFNIDDTFNLQEVTDRGSNTTNSIFTSGNITATSGYFDTFDMTPLVNGSQPPHLEGRLFYDSDNHTLSLYNDEADVSLQLGQEQFLRVRNNTGSTITNGTAVFITGAHGSAAPTISGAIATSESSAQVVGLSTHDIENNSFGYVTTYGIVRNVDTSQYSDGDEIFLSATQIGSGVNVSPTIPNYKVTIGHVIRSHDSNGSVLVQTGNPKLGGGDLKSEAALNMSGVPFVTSISDITAGGSQTDPLFVFDSGNRQLQVGSGIQLLDGVPSNTSNVLYNDSGSLYFNGSEVAGSYTAGSGLTLDGTEFNVYGGSGHFRDVAIENDNTGGVPLKVVSASGQTANLQEWQDETGTSITEVDSDGNIRKTGSLTVSSTVETSISGGQRVSLKRGSSAYLGLQAANDIRYPSATTTSWTTGSSVANSPDISLGRVASNILGVYTSAAKSSYGDVALRNLDATGQISAASVEVTGTTILTASAATEVPIIARGAVSQSANLQEWQDSSEVVKAYIDSDGSISSKSLNAIYNQGIFWRFGSNQVGNIKVDSSTMQFFVNTTRSFSLFGSGPVIGNGQSLQFSTSSTPTAFSTEDLSISRAEAGVLRVSRHDTGQLGDIMVSGVMASGHVQLAENTPADTTNKLYNNAGTLYFNGSEVASNSLKKRSIQFVSDGGGSVLTTGVKSYVTVPYDCTVQSWTILAENSGSVVVDVWKDTYANYPPTAADTITGSEKPTISSGIKNQDNSLTTWTTALSQGDVLGFNIDSVTDITKFSLSIDVEVA